ncbi:MAG: outer membrane protein assembly factor BamD, partial [Burkholderiaceae bacterium]
MTRHLSAAVLLTAAAILGGCAASKPKDITADWSPNRIYQEAKDEESAGQFEKAAALYEKLEGRAAGTPLAQQAQLDKAYMHFKGAEPALALAAVKRFKRLHPGSPAKDYALYLEGLVNFNDDLGLFGKLADVDLSERDQKAAKDSYASFNELIERFPDSRYSKDAALRIGFIVNSLAQSEVNVAKYYLERRQYLAAANRAQYAITNFKDAPALEEALIVLVAAYDAMEMTQLRDDAQRVLKASFPNAQRQDGG